jgi:hypothetical protein
VVTEGSDHKAALKEVEASTIHHQLIEAFLEEEAEVVIAATRAWIFMILYKRHLSKQ